MSTQAVNFNVSFKMDETEILDMKHVADVFHMSVADLINHAVHAYLSELKSDPFYRLTSNVQDASEEERAEILSEMEGLTNDDLTIVSMKRFSICGASSDKTANG